MEANNYGTITESEKKPHEEMENDELELDLEAAQKNHNSDSLTFSSHNNGEPSPRFQDFSSIDGN